MQVQTLHEDPRIISNDEVLPGTRDGLAGRGLELITLIVHRFSPIFLLAPSLSFSSSNIRHAYVSLLDKRILLVDVHDVHSQSNTIHEQPVPDQRHKRSHYKRGEQVHVQPVSGVPELSKREN